MQLWEPGCKKKKKRKKKPFDGSVWEMLQHNTLALTLLLTAMHLHRAEIA